MFYFWIRRWRITKKLSRGADVQTDGLWQGPLCKGDNTVRQNLQGVKFIKKMIWKENFFFICKASQYKIIFCQRIESLFKQGERAPIRVWGRQWGWKLGLRENPPRWCHQEGLCAQGDFFQRFSTFAIKCFTFILVPMMVPSSRIVCLEVMFLWVIRLKLLRIGYSRKIEIFLFPLISFFLEGGTYLVCASSGEQGLQGWKYLQKILNRQNNRAATALSAFAMIGMAATQGKG